MRLQAPKTEALDRRWTRIDVSSLKLGSFEGLTTGMDPVVSYATKVCKTEGVAEVKWLPEFDPAPPYASVATTSGSSWLRFFDVLRPARPTRGGF